MVQLSGAGQGYTAYDREGRKVSGTLEADSEQVAEDILWQSDLIVDQVRRVRKRPALHTIAPSLFGVKERDTIALIRQLATLLDSGLAMLLALEALSHEKAHPMIREALKGTIQFVSQGGQFSEGISRFPSLFPPLFVRLARIGEQTGDLSEVLRRGADYLESQSVVKSKLRASLTYPAIVGATAAVSVYILLNFSIPMLSGLLDEFGADLPLITRMLMAVSSVASSFGLYILLLIVITVVSLILYRRRPNGKLVTDRYFLQMPMFGAMIQKSGIARITQTLTSLLASGIPLLEAVQLTRDNTDNSVMKEGLERVRLELLAGSSFSDSLSLSPVFPPILVEMSRVGENAGNLADQLEVLSKVIQQDFDASISRLVGMLEPAMILVVGGVVAVIGITVITTVYSVLPEIS